MTELKYFLTTLFLILLILSPTVVLITNSQTTQSVQPEGTLVVMASPVGTWQDNFNPWNDPNNPAYTGLWLIYEPLALVNYLNGETIPWLATNWTIVSTTFEGKSTLAVILYLRHNIYFSNGYPFNATAVWYTIGLEQAYPQLGFLAGEVANISIINPYEVEVVFAPGQTEIDLYNLLEQFIVDPAQWSQYFPIKQLPNGTFIGLNKTGNPYTWDNPNPIGTGPYMLYSYSPQQIVLVANPHYWMPGEPRIKYILFPAYSSNVPAAEALYSDQIDWAGLFEPGLQQNFIARNPSYNHYYFATAYSYPIMLQFNLLKWPLSCPVLREAISLAINRTAIYYLGEYGYEPPASSVLPLPKGMYSYINSSILKEAEYLSPAQGNVTAAIQLLESNGWKIENGHLIAPNGTSVPTMTIIAPAGWTDWDADLNLIANDLKQIGITVEVETPPYGTWFSDLMTGNYWLTLMWVLITGPQPIFYFQGYFYNYYNSPGNVTPIGKYTYYDMERFNLSTRLAPNIPPANILVYYAWDNITNPKVEDQLINDLAALWVKYLPATALMYAALWYEYVNATITGWPSVTDYYWPASPYTSLPSTPLPVVLALHLTNQSVPEPWWYYTSKVPASWYTSNNPFVYETTTSVISSSTTTVVSTTTTTPSSSSNTLIYAIIGVIVVVIVALVVLRLRK